jgi:hypothetical protein
MAMGSPLHQSESFIRQFVESPDFARLSPAAQQAFVTAASDDTTGYPRTPQFRAAVDEASSKGLMPGWDWKHFLLSAGALGGLAAVPFVIGGAAATGATAAATGSGAAGGVGPLAGGYGAATTAATVPPALAATGGGAGGILGALGRYAPMIGDVANVTSEAAGGMADGRRADAQINARGIAENNQAKVQAAKYNLDLPSVRTNQVARGEVLNTMQDAPMTGDARIDKFAGGGLRPSAFGPQSRQAGAELSRTALTHLMDPSTDRLTPQEIPETDGSLAENIMGGAGLAGNIISLLGP